MAWPEPRKLVKAIDISWYQNKGPDYDYAPFPLEDMLDAHQEIELVVVRANWPRGGADAYFTRYYDIAEQKGRKVAAYLWPNPFKTQAQTEEDWKTALDGREPKLLALDFEMWKDTKDALTRMARRSLDSLTSKFDFATPLSYTGAWWWDANLYHGWEHEYKWWIAFYPVPNHLKRQLQTFAEFDAMLPIHNEFTPYVGKYIPAENVVAWQFSAKGQFLHATTDIDMDSFKKEFIDQVYGQENSDDLAAILFAGLNQIIDIASALKESVYNEAAEG